MRARAPDCIQHKQRAAAASAAAKGRSPDAKVSPEQQEGQRLRAQVAQFQKAVAIAAARETAAPADGAPPASAEESAEDRADRELAEHSELVKTLRAQKGPHVAALLADAERREDELRKFAHTVWSPERQRKRADARLQRLQESLEKKDAKLAAIDEQLAELQKQKESGQTKRAEAARLLEEAKAEHAKLPPVPMAEAAAPAAAASPTGIAAQLAELEQEDPSISEAVRAILAAAASRKDRE